MTQPPNTTPTPTPVGPEQDGDVAAVLARLDEMEAQAQQRLDEAAAGAARTEQITPTGVSERGWVTVVLTSQAVVQAIEVADGAPMHSPDELAAAVRQAHDRALRQWRREVSDIAEEELGDPRLRADVQRAALQGLPERLRGDDDPDTGGGGATP